MKSIYVAREDGDYDFVTAFALEKMESLPNSNVNEYFSGLVLELESSGEEVKVHEVGSVSDLPDVFHPIRSSDGYDN